MLLADAESVRRTRDAYFRLLVEYEARFFAGALRDLSTLVFRLVKGPGTGGPSAFENSVNIVQKGKPFPVHVVPLLCGKGFEWLSPEEIGPLFSEPLIKRVEELLEGTVNLTWSPVVVEPKEYVALRLPAIARDGRNLDPAPASCAANGFDYNGQGSWVKNVGSGSLAAHLAKRGVFEYAAADGTWDVRVDRPRGAPVPPASDDLKLDKPLPHFPYDWGVSGDSPISIDQVPIVSPSMKEMPAIITKQLRLNGSSTHQYRAQSTIAAFFESFVAKLLDPNWNATSR